MDTTKLPQRFSASGVAHLRLRSYLLHNLIEEIAEPFDSCVEPDRFILTYTSPEAAKDAFNKLHDKLYNLHPELIGYLDRGNDRRSNLTLQRI